MSLRKKHSNDNAVSEIIGTQLLLLITVGLFSIIYISILVMPVGDSSPHADIIIGVEGNDIIFYNAGGKGLSLDTQVKLMIDGEEQDSFTVDEHLPEEFKGDDLWSYPEQFSKNIPFLEGKDVTVNIVDVASNSLITNAKIDARNPLNTIVNTIDPYDQNSENLTITARSTGATPDNVTLWYRHQWSWEDSFENDDTYVFAYHNMSFDDGDFVIVNRSGGGDIDYVDQISNDYGPSDIGTHSSFNAQTAGPDSIYDTLLEGDTGGSSETVLIPNESFEGSWLPSGWSETGNWNRESDSEYDGSWSADFDGWWYSSGNLDSPELDCSDATSIYISFYFKEDVDSNNKFEIYLKDSSDNWYNIVDLGGQPSGWNHYTTQITDSQYFHSDFQIRWRARYVQSEEHIYLDYVYITKESGTPNFELDLEEQWTGIVNYSKPVENLCVYVIDTDAEDLIVDVWNETSSSWDELVESISIGWNNVSVTNWLTSPSLTIRYKDGSNVSDSNRGSWEIDSAYLYLIDPENDFSYQGNITSIDITKPEDTSWRYFYADVNDTDNINFNILDDQGSILLTGLNGGRNSISSISNDKIKLFGTFDGSARLNSWNVTVETSGWEAFETIDESEPWNWLFDFQDGPGFYSFYTMAQRVNWDDESPPSEYDTNCYYNSLGG